MAAVELDCGKASTEGYIPQVGSPSDSNNCSISAIKQAFLPEQRFILIKKQRDTGLLHHLYPEVFINCLLYQEYHQAMLQCAVSSLSSQNFSISGGRWFGEVPCSITQVMRGELEFLPSAQMPVSQLTSLSVYALSMLFLRRSCSHYTHSTFPATITNYAYFLVACLQLWEQLAWLQKHYSSVHNQFKSCWPSARVITKFTSPSTLNFSFAKLLILICHILNSTPISQTELINS